MLKCKQEGDRILMYNDRTDRKDLELIDYCWLTRSISRVRVLRYYLVPGKSIQTVEEALKSFPNARIRHLLGHEPMFTQRETELILGQVKKPEEIASAHRVILEHVPLIDDFGFHIYIRGELDYRGDLPDIDLRYND